MIVDRLHKSCIGGLFFPLNFNFSFGEETDLAARSFMFLVRVYTCMNSMIVS